MKVLLLAVLAFTSLHGAESATKLVEFWLWFTTKEEVLFSFERDQEKLFDELSAQLKKIGPDLTFEFGPKNDDTREFVISAGGIKKSFPLVQALARSAPKLSRFTITEFRPRRKDVLQVEFFGTVVKPGDVRYKLESDNGKIGICLFIRGLPANDDKHIYAQIGYLFLDQALGEYVVETKVGFIEQKPLTAEAEGLSEPINILATSFDAFLPAKAKTK